MLTCPDCGPASGLQPERDEDTGELFGFVCATCHGFFEDAPLDDEGD